MSTTKTKKVYHDCAQAAIRDGWLNVYEGDREFRGRFYGKKKGNHRIWRCYKLNQEQE